MAEIPKEITDEISLAVDMFIAIAKQPRKNERKKGHYYDVQHAQKKITAYQ